MRYLLFIFLILTSCSSSNSVMDNLIISPSKNGLKYLSLGDSYTIGESVKTDERWSVILSNLLSQQKFQFETLNIIAKTGWTTSELQAAVIGQAPKNEYDLVSLLIGVNNQYRGQSIDTYRKEFRALLNSSIDLAKGRVDRVFVLSIPDWGVTPFAAGTDKAKTAREIDAFNAAAKEECAKLGIVFIDITPISRTATNDRTQIASDGLHFSGLMYKQWADAALPTVKRLLEK